MSASHLSLHTSSYQSHQASCIRGKQESFVYTSVAPVTWTSVFQGNKVKPRTHGGSLALLYRQNGSRDTEHVQVTVSSPD